MGRDESAATSPNPSFLLPRSHSHFGSHPSLIAGKTTPLFSYTCVEPILQPFCFQIHACNGGGCPPSSGSRLPIPYPLSPTCPQQSRGIPFLFTFLRNLLHSRKSQLFSFQAIPHSLRKTTRGGGPSAVFAIAGEPRANAREQISRTP